MWQNIAFSFLPMIYVIGFLTVIAKNLEVGRFFMDYLVGRMSYIFFCVTNFKFNEEVLYMKKSISSKTARTILIVPISAELLNVSLLKTISPIIKTITSKTDFALKYQHPYTKHILNNTAKISADSISASLLFPLAYQQAKDNNGETAVNPNQIIA